MDRSIRYFIIGFVSALFVVWLFFSLFQMMGTFKSSSRTDAPSDLPRVESRLTPLANESGYMLQAKILLPEGSSGPVKGQASAGGTAYQGSIPAQGGNVGQPPYRGSANTPIKLVEYADFHCGFCRQVNDTLRQVMAAFPGQIQWIFRHHPLSTTPGKGSYLIHEASLCAQEQNKFWEFYDEAFAVQGGLKEADLPNAAQKIGLNITQFNQCLQGGKYRNIIDQDLAEAQRLGVSGTPNFFINEKSVPGAMPFEHFVGVIDEVLKAKGLPGYQPGLVPSAPVQPTQPVVPAVVQVQAPVTFDDLKGRPSAGPENAKVTIVEFSDFHCPFCKKATPTMAELMKNYSGKIRRVWRHYPLKMHTGADRTHEASECAHEQNKFWEYHDQLFERLGTSWNDETLISLAKELGLNEKKFRGCLETGKYKDLIQKEIEKGSAVGVSGTPAFFINGQKLSGARPYDSFKNLVEYALDPSKLPPPQAAPPVQPTAPMPPAKPVEFGNLDKYPSRGSKNAPITLVEFSDFHCPFCQRVTGTLDQLIANYGDKIRLVWRHYPLAMHAGAERTHQASECAHEQGKFWEYHNKLFGNMVGARDDQALTLIAKDLGLNTKKFEECLASNKYTEFIKEEIKAGTIAGVNGTPAIFVNGELVSGALPYNVFDSKIQEKLKKS